MMNRREFLSFSLGLGITVLLPEPRDDMQLETFDSRYEYSRSIAFYGSEIPQNFLSELEAMLIVDARETLPAGTPFEILRSVSRPQSMAWYYSPHQVTQEPGPIEGRNYTLVRQVRS